MTVQKQKKIPEIICSWKSALAQVSSVTTKWCWRQMIMEDHKINIMTVTAAFLISFFAYFFYSFNRWCCCCWFVGWLNVIVVVVSFRQVDHKRNMKLHSLCFASSNDAVSTIKMTIQCEWYRQCTLNHMKTEKKSTTTTANWLYYTRTRAYTA